MNRRYIFVFLLVFGLVVVSYVHYQFNNNRETVDILLVNGTVITMVIFRGFADDLPTQEWLEYYIWPAEAKYINAETVRLGTLLAIAEMIRSGTTTFNDMYMDSLGVLGDNVIAAHCVHLTEEDIQLIAHRKVGVAHDPESNMKLASGVAPIPDLLDAGVKIGLGTDGAASNNDLNMFEEMDTTAKLHKVFRHDPTVIDAQTVVEMATIGGARVLGLDDQIGSIEEGKRADIIVIDLNKPHTIPLYNPYSHIVYVIDGADVETVIIDGKTVMLNQKILTINEEEIIRDIRALK